MWGGDGLTSIPSALHMTSRWRPRDHRRIFRAGVGYPRVPRFAQVPRFAPSACVMVSSRQAAGPVH